MKNMDKRIKKIVKDNTFVTLHRQSLLDLIHWARRYCDMRSTFAPSTFNSLYNHIKDTQPEALIDEFDDSEVCKFFPYAQNGMYDEKT